MWGPRVQWIALAVVLMGLANLASRSFGQVDGLVFHKGRIPATYQSVRTWTDDTGAYRVHARLYSIHQQGIRLLKVENQVVIFVPFSRLGFDEQLYIESIVRKLDPTLIVRSVSPGAPRTAEYAASRSGSTKVTLTQEATTSKVGQAAIIPASDSDPLQPPVTRLELNYLGELQSSVPKNSANLAPFTMTKSNGGMESNHQVTENSMVVDSIGPSLSGGELTEATLKTSSYILENSKSVVDQRQALDAIIEYEGKLDDSTIRVLQTATAAEDWVCRQKAINALCVHDVTLALSVVSQRLEDPNRRVRMEAYRFLQSHPSRTTMELLLDRLKSSDRRIAATVLESYGKECQAELLGLLSDEILDLRLTVSELLGKSGDAKALAPLEDLSKSDENSKVRVAALTAARQIRARLTDEKSADSN